MNATPAAMFVGAFNTNLTAAAFVTSKVVIELAEEYGVDMPIAMEVVQVVHGGRPASEAYRGLLKREISLERG